MPFYEYQDTDQEDQPNLTLNLNDLDNIDISTVKDLKIGHLCKYVWF